SLDSGRFVIDNCSDCLRGQRSDARAGRYMDELAKQCGIRSWACCGERNSLPERSVSQSCAAKRHTLCASAVSGVSTSGIRSHFFLSVLSYCLCTPPNWREKEKLCHKTIANRNGKDRTRPSWKDRTPRSRNRRSSRLTFSVAKKSRTSRRC